MNNILIIDSTKGLSENVTSLHARNSRILRDTLNCTLIDSDKLDRKFCKKYDSIIFVHASPYTSVSSFDDLIKLNKDSNYFYILNDYYLGEPPILWFACKKYNIRYHVIANHAKDTTAKIVLKYVNNWYVTNLNSLIYSDMITKKETNTLSDLFDCEPNKYKIGYYGAFRKGRIKYFKKYFDERMIVSTSNKNKELFMEVANKCYYINRLNWDTGSNTLGIFNSSLYIEDEYTNNNYSCFANRFYEALSYNIPSFFDISCLNTIKQSNYPINDWYIVNTANELHDKLNSQKWENYHIEKLKILAEKERTNTLKEILTTIKGVD